jgi:two-component system, chemotaxis family, chemotaxis protein CheY
LVEAPSDDRIEAPGSGGHTTAHHVEVFLLAGLLHGTLQVLVNVRLSDFLRQQTGLLVLRDCRLVPYGEALESPKARKMRVVLLNMGKILGVGRRPIPYSPRCPESCPRGSPALKTPIRRSIDSYGRARLCSGAPRSLRLRWQPSGRRSNTTAHPRNVAGNPDLGESEAAVRLLIVEDSALIRKVTHLAFPSRTHELQEAENGVQALALLAHAAPFDAIVLDLRMPDMDGVEFLRRLRRDARHGQTPVVVATSEGEDSALLQEIRRLGVGAIIKKPWKPQELARLVTEAAGGGQKNTP